MPEDIDTLLRRLTGGDPTAADHVRDLARTTDVPALLVAAAFMTRQSQEFLGRALRSAVTTRDRQLIAVTTAHLNGDTELLDVLVREHLSDFPDNILAVWIAAENARPAQPLHPGSSDA